MKNVKTQKLVRVSLLCAISVILVYFIHFPLVPSAPFLEYDPADISIILTGLSYGTGWGLLATVITSLIQGLTVSSASGWIGIVMHIVSTGVFVTVTSSIYQKSSKLTLSLIPGVIAMVLIMIPINLIFTGIFMNAGVMAVAKMLIPAIIPFNLLKAGINALVAGLIFTRIKNIAVID